VAPVSMDLESMPPQRRAGSTEMRLRIGVLIWYPNQAEVCTMSVVGRSAGNDMGGSGWVKYTLK
jgi:hypothetical protein